MNKLENEIAKLEKEVAELSEEKENLENNKTVINYIKILETLVQKEYSLMDKKHQLRKSKINKEYIKMKDKYSKCHHYTIADPKTGYSTCILCDITNAGKFKNDPTIKEVAMEIYQDNEGGDISMHAVALQNRLYACDTKIAKAIITKIKEANKEIKRAELFKYFEIALDNMIDIEVSDKRINGRAKRLGVRPMNVRNMTMYWEKQ